MSPRAARWLGFAAAFAIGLVLLMPLSIALGWSALADAGLMARKARGTVWRGELVDAAFGPVALGDLDTRLSALPLLLGRTRLSLSRVGSDPFAATVEASRGGVAIRHATGRIATGTLFAPAPMERLELDNVSARFEQGRCVDASGDVRAMPAGPLVAVLPGLSGAARCDGEALLLPLAAGGGRIDLRLFADGRYRIEARVVATTPALAAALEAAGFSASERGYVLQRAGNF